MKTVPVFSPDGLQIGVLETKHDFTPIRKRRVGKIESHPNLFYKGTGVQYTNHFVRSPDASYTVIKKNDTKYVGYSCSKNCFTGKFGIFLERFQPYFSDYIGGCGNKEDAIIKNSVDMGDLTNVTVKDRFFNSEFNTRIFLIEYSNTVQLSDSNIKFSKLDSLFQKIIQSDWRCTWDKNIFKDLDSDCKIHDPADWFISPKFNHLFGTLYCILYSAFSHIGKWFSSIMDSYKFPVRFALQTIPLHIFFLVSKYRRNIIPNEPLLSSKYTLDTYRNLMKKYLLNGKYTCEIEFPEENESEKREYMEFLLKKYF